MIIVPELNSLPDGIGLALTSRIGGYSKAPFESNNLALHVGDNANDVEQNRSGLLAQLEGADSIQWLQQVHGTKLIHADASLAKASRSVSADACLSSEVGVACAVLTADCLPVLLWRNDGQSVVAAHAGWRGLSAGILRNSVTAMTEVGSGNKPELMGKSQISAYLGPAISQGHFEVGIDVLETFFASALNDQHMDAIAKAFKPCINKSFKFYADLYQLARAELAALGIAEVFGGGNCSFEDTEHCYSYRRAKQQSNSDTGRMASLIWRKF